MSRIVALFVFTVAAYFVGAIPFSLLLVRWRTGIDLRKFGSGNVGATNARRAAGTLLGAVALICDAAKGGLPTFAAVQLASLSPQTVPEGYAALVAVAAVAGHMYPVYLKFKPSGKGVGTALGCFLVLAPLAVCVALGVFVATVVIFRRMSLGSLIAAGVLPLAVWLTAEDAARPAASFVITLMIIMRHKDNIRRLRQGQEPKL